MQPRVPLRSKAAAATKNEVVSAKLRHLLSLSEEMSIVSTLDFAAPLLSQASAASMLLLPLDLYFVIFEYLDVLSLCRVSAVSVRWQNCASQDFLWSKFLLRYQLQPKIGASPKETVCCYIQARQARMREEENRAAEAFNQASARMQRHLERAGSYGAALNYDETENASVSHVVSQSEAKLGQLVSSVESYSATQLALTQKASQLKDSFSLCEKQIKQLNSMVCEQRNGEDRASVVSEFERHICFCLLSTAAELPVVLRRGIRSFHAFELLILQSGQSFVSLQQKWERIQRQLPVDDVYLSLSEKGGALTDEEQCRFRICRHVSQLSIRDSLLYFGISM